MKKLICALAAVCLTAAAQEQKPTAYMVADAHLDTQWNWDIQTTIREHVRNTIDQNLYLLETYPDYIFNFEGAVKYGFMKEYYPREFEHVKEYVRDGRWHVSGASWEASDAIVPSVESFIRNILQGQTFYRDEFGVESTDIFLPDCFGFGWTLPTVANHCGLIGFSSQKLQWRHNNMHGDSKIPFTLGVWRGVDGSEIMLAHCYDYTGRYYDTDISHDRNLLARANLGFNGEVLHYYGTGDIGGSPTTASVRSVEAGLRGDGPVRIVSAPSDALYKKYYPYSAHPEIPRYDGELLMDVHGTGCYTSEAAMKLYNRQNEQLGDAAERASVVAEYVAGEPYPSQSITEAWRRFLWHQFHDDLTGTSLPRAYEFSWNDELLSLKQFAGVMNNAATSVADRLDTRVKGIPVVVYNPLGTDAADLVEITLPAKARPASAAVYDAQGRRAAAQVVGYADGRATILVETKAPSVGFAVYDVRLSGKAKADAPAPANTLENSRYRLAFNADGDIASLYDKVAGRELVKEGRAIRLALFTHNPSEEWPAWEILKSTVDSEPVSIGGDVSVTLVERGPLRTTALVEKRRDGSTFRQYVSLYEGALADRIDFRNEIDWNLTDALLKAEFPLAIANGTATYGLGVGAVERGNNTPAAYEVYSHYWADLTDRGGDYGVTVLNDSKYGWDKPDDNTLRLTLLHTPSTSRRYAYQARQDHGFHTFTYSLLPHAGALVRSDADRSADRLNQPSKAFAAAKHAGPLGRAYGFVSASAPNVAVKALKKAEKGDEIVLRVYETAGRPVDGAYVEFPAEILAAQTADGTEKALADAPFDGRRLRVTLPANGIATYRLRLAGASAPADRRQAAVALPLNRSCFSPNEFRNDANFCAGYSYALELIPGRLTVDGIGFDLIRQGPAHGLACKGDTLALPEGFNRLYILAAAASDDSRAATFRLGAAATEVEVPSYTGFVGQWGHDGHTEGYLRDARVAYVGTHRHSSEGDHPYEFTYMYLYGLDIPAGAREIVLPDNPDVVLFAMTAVDETRTPLAPASTQFRTANRPAGAPGCASQPRRSILTEDAIIGCSGYCNDREQPRFLVDGDITTKWCDVSRLPNYVDFDLGAPAEIHGWELTNAAVESPNYVTAACFLQGKLEAGDEWQTIDYFTGNRGNVVSRTLADPATARYLRLLVTRQEQDNDRGATRIYDLKVY